MKENTNLQGLGAQSRVCGRTSHPRRTRPIDDKTWQNVFGKHLRRDFESARSAMTSRVSCSPCINPLSWVRWQGTAGDATQYRSAIAHAGRHGTFHTLGYANANLLSRSRRFRPTAGTTRYPNPSVTWCWPVGWDNVWVRRVGCPVTRWASNRRKKNQTWTWRLHTRQLFQRQDA